MKNLILTDVDGTLTRKSVVLSHAGFLIEKGIIKDDGSFKAWKKDVKNEIMTITLIRLSGDNLGKELDKSIDEFSQKIESEFDKKISVSFENRNIFHAIFATPPILKNRFAKSAFVDGFGMPLQKKTADAIPEAFGHQCVRDLVKQHRAVEHHRERQPRDVLPDAEAGLDLLDARADGERDQRRDQEP